MKPASEDRHIGCDNLGLASLSLASGCTDVLSFLKLGNLFTSTMTGNTALLAVAIGGGQLFAALRSLTVAAVVLALGFSEISGKLERSTR